MTAATAATRESAAPAPPLAPVVRFEGVGLSADVAGARASFALLPGAMLAVEGSPIADVAATPRIAALRVRPPAEGTVWLDGRDARAFGRREAAAWRARVGYLDAGPAALDHLSVYDNAALRRRLAGEQPDHYAGPVEELLRWLNLWRRAADRAATLEPGEQRRLSLAIALCRGPDLLIADRPDEDLDDVARAGLLRMISEARRAGTAVLIACSPASLSRLAPDAVLRLRDGRAELGDR